MCHTPFPSIQSYTKFPFRFNIFFILLSDLFNVTGGKKNSQLLTYLCMLSACKPTLLFTPFKSLAVSALPQASLQHPYCSYWTAKPLDLNHAQCNSSPQLSLPSYQRYYKKFFSNKVLFKCCFQGF